MKRKPYITFRDWERKAMKNRAFRKALAEPDDDIHLETAYQLVMLRRKEKLTQAQLAKKMGVTQQAVARLECMRYKGHSLKTLQRVADVLHKKLRIQFV